MRSCSVEWEDVPPLHCFLPAGLAEVISPDRSAWDPVLDFQNLREFASGTFRNRLKDLTGLNRFCIQQGARKFCDFPGMGRINPPSRNQGSIHLFHGKHVK